MFSRAKIHTGLVPGRWVVVFQKEESSENVAYRYSGFTLGMRADSGYVPATVGVPTEKISSPVTIAIQDSNDGVTWTTRWTNKSTPMNPGADLAVSYFQQGKYVRVLATSASGGILYTSIYSPEEQASTGTWPDGPTVFTCDSFCEIDCETGAETSD